MQLQFMTVENFLSFGAPQLLDFAEAKGLVLIDGRNEDDPLAASNGSGKSAIIEALVWGLYGQTLRGLRGDDVINEKVGKQCKVYISGVLQSGEEWIIERWRKCGRRKNGLHFSVGGKDLTSKERSSVTQSLIDAEFGSYSAFTNTTVFGQGARWRFTELSDGDKKKVLDEILGTTALSTARALASSRRGAVLRECEATRSELDLTQAKMEAIEESIEAVREVVKVERRQQRRHLKDSIEDLRVLLKKARAGGDPEEGEVRGKLAEVDEQLDVLKAEIEVQRLQLKRERVGHDSALKDHQKAWSAYEDIVERLQAIEEVGDGECPTCGRSFDDEDAWEEHVTQMRLECEVAERAKKAFGEVLSRASDRFNRVEAKLRGLEGDLSIALARREGVLVRLDEMERGQKGRAKELQSLIRQRKAEYEALSSRKIGVTKRERELRERSKKLTDTIKELNAELKRKTGKMRLYEFWEKAFGPGGIKSHLLDHVVPVLNERAARYSKLLTRGIAVEFDTESQLKSGETRDKFDVVVSNRHGTNRYAGSSGGERRKVDIVVARSLQSLEQGKAALNFTWWDEVFESLDETSCEAVMDLLRAEAETKDAVFVVSHLEWLAPHFNRVLRVVKRDGFSQLRWE